MKHKGIFKRLSLLTLLLIAGFTSAMAQSLYMDGFKINTGEVKTVSIDLAQGGYSIYGLSSKPTAADIYPDDEEIVEECVPEWNCCLIHWSKCHCVCHIFTLQMVFQFLFSLIMLQSACQNEKIF